MAKKWIRPTAKERELNQREIAVLKKEKELEIKVENVDRLKKDLDICMVTVKRQLNKVTSFYKMREKVNPKGNQFEYSGTLFIYVSLIIANILMVVTMEKFFTSITTINLSWAIFNIGILFIWYMYSNRIIRRHNKYTIKKGDYRIKDVDYSKKEC